MIINSIKKRRSFRAYKSELVSDERINEIIEAAQFAPTAYDKRAIEFIVIKDQETRKTIAELLEQGFIVEAPVLIGLVATDQANLPVEDISVASAHMLLQATELGLGSVWINFSFKDNIIKKMLGVPDACKMINLVALGFPAEEKPEHSDEEFKIEKIHQEKW